MTRSAVIRRLGVGIGSSGVVQILAALQLVALVPLFLHAWGADAYGRWLALTALLSYLNLLDLGGQTYIANLLAMHHARGDKAAFRKTLSEGVSLFVVIGLAVLAVVLCALFAFGRLVVPGMGRSLRSDEMWILGLLATRYLLFGVPAGIYVTVYRATGSFTRGSVVAGLTLGVGLAISVVMLYYSVSPEVFAAATLGSSVFVTAVMVWDTRRFLPETRGLRIGFAQARSGLEHLGGAVYFWLIAVSQAVGQQGLLLILALTTSPVVVATYATHRTLAAVAGYIPALIQAPVMPELTFLWTRRRVAELRQATFIAIKTVTLMAGVMAMLIWLAGPLVYPLWTLGRLDVHALLLTVLLARGVLSAAWATSVWGLLAANHHRGLALCYFANVVVSLGLAAWLVPTYGMVGVALAGLGADLLCGLGVFPVLAGAFLEAPASRVYSQIGSTVVAVLTLVGIGVVANTLLPGWWSVWAFTLAAVAMAYPMLRLIYGDQRLRTGFEMLCTAVLWPRTTTEA